VGANRQEHIPRRRAPLRHNGDQGHRQAARCRLGCRGLCAVPLGLLAYNGGRIRFTYKTCAFCWLKADPYRLFADDKTPFAGMGYWTRANSEPCLLATRGKPKRLHKDVRQGIIAPRREHSRKPEEVHGRIERLVGGPYLELFARAPRKDWMTWGNQTTQFAGADT